MDERNRRLKQNQSRPPQAATTNILVEDSMLVASDISNLGKTAQSILSNPSSLSAARAGRQMTKEEEKQAKDAEIGRAHV